MKTCLYRKDNKKMVFKSEQEFEKAVVASLQKKGWENEIIKYPTEEVLIKNWANILFENNRGIHQLNDVPLTDSEMQQIMDQVISLRTPLKLNGFINGKTVTITRDNPKDVLHLGKEISLKIYDRREIAAGQSRYQIVQQPIFNSKSPILGKRRGDILLLINGMPVFHLELKGNGVPVSQASYQIERYANAGIYTGIFSLIQLFVAMEPEETIYFANPGPGGVFNKDFFFHWADFNNEPINHWSDITASLLSIPMAHQLIGFYTIADNSDGLLKVLRSYQYYAVNAVVDTVYKMDWDAPCQRGGYIWHTTGSGKTMTSFKAAQLIASSREANKVIFLMDRVELGTQSLREYQGFAEVNEEVQETESTHALISKLKSSNPKDTLIVTSIQKMSRLDKEKNGLKESDLKIINAKRLVFIVDEAHRSTFGIMLTSIKNTFKKAVFFGFTGTPIHEENDKNRHTTASVFGNELHRYSISDGIRDKNVLGFDLYRVNTFRDRDLRKAVALQKTNALIEKEAIADIDKERSKIYYRYISGDKIKMAGYYDEEGDYQKGIEDYIPSTQYWTPKHQETVVKDIDDNWLRLSRNSKFHALYAVSSIDEAIRYYQLFKELAPTLKVTTLFDATIDNNEKAPMKEDALVEILEDYNEKYHQNFTIASYGKFKKDVARRLAHKRPHEQIEFTPEKQLDLLIVVDQMLTGYDSKWVNTLYLDKLLKYESIIQAFSRTNRLFGPEKPFGTIRYYRYPNTMERNIKRALDLYSGNKPLGLFANHLEDNLESMNRHYKSIQRLFVLIGSPDFSKTPERDVEIKQFTHLYKNFHNVFLAAQIQGFRWDKQSYTFETRKEPITVLCDRASFDALTLRYKDLDFSKGQHPLNYIVPFDLDTYLLEQDAGMIDDTYLNQSFAKYYKTLKQKEANPEGLQLLLEEIHQFFPWLTQEEQKYATLFLHDIQAGDILIEEGKPFREYLNDYQYQSKNKQLNTVEELFGIDGQKLEQLINESPNEVTLNEYGRFDNFLETVDKKKARDYFESKESNPISPFQLNKKINNLFKKIILTGNLELVEIPSLSSTTSENQ